MTRPEVIKKNVYIFGNPTRSASREGKYRDVANEPSAAVSVESTQRVGGYESWWDVPVAEVSPLGAVNRARAAYESARERERTHL